MKKLIYNEYTKEIDSIEEKEVPEINKEKPSRPKRWLENNKIFFEVFSYVFVGIMGIVISFVGLKFNKKTVDIYQRQIDIIENDKKPRFSIKCDILPDDSKNIGADGKMPKYYYSIANEGEDITEVSINPESYLYFCIPTTIEDEYYIFKFHSYDFWSDCGRSIIPVEKDKEYSFAEYIIKEENMSEWMAIAKIVSKFLPDLKCIQKNIVSICYTDYMGEEKEELFTFNDWNMKKAPDDEKCILLEDNYGNYSNDDLLDVILPKADEIAEKIKKEIEDWLKKNKGRKGYEIPDSTRFEYIG